MLLVVDCIDLYIRMVIPYNSLFGPGGGRSAACLDTEVVLNLRCQINCMSRQAACSLGRVVVILARLSGADVRGLLTFCQFPQRQQNNDK